MSPIWVKIDDKMHAHRKTRRVVTSDGDKRRDAAPMGIWLLAASWAGQNGTGGWVPEHELDRWDDDWEELAHRLIRAEFWWPEEQDGEPGYGFVDWEDYNPASGSSEAGTFGNHKRWHENRGIVEPGCPHCPSEPDDLDMDGPSGGDIGGRSGGDIPPDSLNIALPDPTRPEPDPKTPSSADADKPDPMARFDEFWDAYGKKVGRKVSEKRWQIALRKKDVGPDLLINAAKRYVGYMVWEGKHPKFTKDPATWLNGEHWTDELPTVPTERVADLPTVAEVQRMREEREARERGESA